jgi:peptide chain release factor
MAAGSDKWRKLEARMEELEIREEDLVEKFILGSGPGGQKIQKTHSTVYLKHVPTGIEIKCQRERSRDLNRYYARQDLCERVDELRNESKSRKQQEIEKVRRQKRRRSRRSKEKMLEEKKRRGDVKTLRKPPDED